jgi:hypothetical protein
MDEFVDWFWFIGSTQVNKDIYHTGYLIGMLTAIWIHFLHWIFIEKDVLKGFRNFILKRPDLSGAGKDSRDRSV